MRYLMMQMATDQVPDEQLFTEAKEAVGGFALVEVRSKEEAIELARRFRGIVGDGESRIHQVFGP